MSSNSKPSSDTFYFLIIFAIVAILVLLPGCKSHKEIVSAGIERVDSVRTSEHYRSIATIDSVIRQTTFLFDTLEVTVERPVEYASTPEVIRLRAINGNVSDNRQQLTNSTENYNRLDSIALKKDTSQSFAQKTDNTAVYDPPDTTAILVCVVLGLTGIYIILKKK